MIVLAKAKKRKPNPSRIPVTKADLEKAKKEAQKKAVDDAIAIFLTVLLDKEGADQEIIQRVFNEIGELSQEITDKRITIADLRCVLREEYNIYC